MNNPKFPAILSGELSTSGSRSSDRYRLNKQLGSKRNPAGMDWHHSDKETVDLVPKPIHQSTPHIGAIQEVGKDKVIIKQKPVSKWLFFIHITPFHFFIDYIWNDSKFWKK